MGVGALCASFACAPQSRRTSVMRRRKDWPVWRGGSVRGGSVRGGMMIFDAPRLQRAQNRFLNAPNRVEVLGLNIRNRRFLNAPNRVGP